MNTKELQKIVKNLLLATTEKGLISGMENIIIFNGEMIAFNDRKCVSALIDGLDFECAINASDLNKIIKGIKEKEINVSLEKGKLIITSESTDASIPVNTDVIDPILDMVEELAIPDLEFFDLPDNFIKGVSLSEPIVSDDVNSEEKTYCLKIKDNTMYATDRFRVSRFFLNAELPEFLISKNLLKDILSFNPTEFSISDKWIHFKNEDNIILSGRLVDDSKNKFFNIDKVFESIPQERTKFELPEELKEVLESILILHDENSDSHKTISVNVNKGEMVIEFVRTRAIVKKKIKVDKKCPKITFSISSAFFAKIIEYTNTLQIVSPKALFETDDFQQITMLASEK